jgi:hypothetical protein
MPTLIVIRGNSGSGKTTAAREPFDESVRRNAARGFTVDEVRGWWAPDDLLGVPGERVLTAPGVEDAVSTILHTSGLASAAALTPCPTRCPRCVAALS